MIRLLIALELNEAMQQAMAAVQRSLRQRGDLPVRWVASQQAHLTLQFLGNVVTTHVPMLVRAVAPAVARYPTMLLRAGEVGAFPSVDAPRVLWLGVTLGAAPLCALAERLQEGLRERRFQLDERKFRPHLTLGRVKPRGDGAARRALEAIAPGELARFRVRSVELMQSVLSPGGARHTALRSFALSEVAPFSRLP